MPPKSNCRYCGHRKMLHWLGFGKCRGANGPCPADCQKYVRR